MEDLRKSCIEARKAIERYTDMFKEFSKQLLFIYSRDGALDLPLMKLQLMLRNYGKDENDDVLKQEFETLDKNIISFHQGKLSKSQLIMVLENFEDLTLFRKSLECDNIFILLQYGDLLENQKKLQNFLKLAQNKNWIWTKNESSREQCIICSRVLYFIVVVLNNYLI